MTAFLASPSLIRMGHSSTRLDILIHSILARQLRSLKMKGLLVSKPNLNMVGNLATPISSLRLQAGDLSLNNFYH